MSIVLLAATFNLLTNACELVQTEIRDEGGTNTWVMADAWNAHIDTGLFPVVAGRSYTARFRRLHKNKGSLWAQSVLYDADGYLTTNSIKSVTISPEWGRDFPYSVGFTVPSGVRYLRYFIYCKGDGAVLDAFELKEVDEKGETARPSPEHPDYEVVLPARFSKPLEFAATELRHWIKEITGRIPPLVRGKPKGASKRQRLYLGRDFLKEDAGPHDSWLVTCRGRDIYLVSNDDEGVVNAVFDLLERNTDIIFARSASEDGTVFSKNPGLKFEQVEFRVTPAFRERAFALGFFNYPSALCLRRNYVNFNGGPRSKLWQEGHGRIYWRTTLMVEFGGLIPNAKYFKDHPEFYGEKQGTRRPYEHYGVQPCYTSREGMRAMSSNLVAYLKRDMTPNVVRVNVGYGDTWTLCTCANCRKPITLPSGRVLKADDEEFRSYQFYTFAKEVLAEAQRLYPKLEFLIGGYLYAAVPPPEFKFAPMTSVMFCPYPKVCSEPVYCDDHNAKWHARSEAWAKSGALINIYEYYGNAFDSGRPGADMAQKDLIYWSEKGMDNHFYSEMPYDVRAVDKKTGRISNGGLGWDLGLMENWVMTRLFVDPKRDVEKLRDDFCRRAYREAASEMREFFGGIRKAWYANPKTKGWGENAVNSMNDHIRAQKLDKPLRELLVTALKKAQHPKSKGLIRRTLEAWDQIRADAEKAAPSAKTLPELNGFDGALTITCSNTVFSCYHAGGVLHVKAVCTGVPAQVGKASSTEGFPNGEAVGFLIRAGMDENAPHYHFLVTPDGMAYDAKGYDYHYNLAGYVAKAKRGKTGWAALFTVPLADLKINPTLGKPFGFIGVRAMVGKDGAYTLSTSNGKPVHDTKRYHEVNFN